MVLLSVTDSDWLISDSLLGDWLKHDAGYVQYVPVWTLKFNSLIFQTFSELFILKDK